MVAQSTIGNLSARMLNNQKIFLSRAARAEMCKIFLSRAARAAWPQNFLSRASRALILSKKKFYATKSN